MAGKLRMIVFAVVLGVATTFISPLRANAAATCYDVGCTDADHLTSGCDADKVTIAAASPPPPSKDARIDVILYYSNVCHSVWAYFYTDDSSLHGSAFQIWSQSTYGGPEEMRQISLETSMALYSPMVPWSQSAKACYTSNPGRDPEGGGLYEGKCTSWR